MYIRESDGKIISAFPRNKMNLEAINEENIFSCNFWKCEENDILLVLKFIDQKFQTLSDFLNSEVHNFYLHVREALGV